MNKKLLVVLSEAQHASLKAAAKARGVEASELVRKALARAIPDFPQDLEARTKHKSAPEREMFWSNQECPNCGECETWLIAETKKYWCPWCDHQWD